MHIHLPLAHQRTIARVYIGVALVCVLMCLLLLSPQKASAHPHANGPTFSVTLGFNGIVRQGFWTPVQIKLSGGTSDFTGTVMVDVPTNDYGSGSKPPTNSYQTPVDLPAGGQKQVTLYVPLPQNVQGLNQVLNVHLLDTSGQTVSSQQVPATLASAYDVFVGVLSNQNVGFGSLNAIPLNTQGSHVNMVTLTAATFPTQASVLKNFDMLIIDHFDTSSLTSQQLNALEQWVNQGGSLVLVGGPEWSPTLSPLPQTLVPVSISGTATLPANTPLLPVGGPARSGGDDATSTLAPSDVTISVAKIHPGATTLLAAGSTPLLVQANSSQGKIFYLAYDLSLSPLTSWPGASNLWQGLLFRILGDKMVNSSVASPQARFLSSTNNVDVVLQILLPNAVPAIWLILVLLAAYLLVIGPIRLLLVRRLKKRSWSWRIILSSIVLFSLLSYGLVLVQKGTSVISDTVSVVQLGTPSASSTSAHITTLVGIYVPNQGDFRIHLSGASLAQPTSNQNGYLYGNAQTAPSDSVISSQDASEVQLKGISTWTMRSMSAEQDGSIAGGITSHLATNGNILSGTITNTLPYTLSDAYVLIGNQILKVGKLATGASVSVRLALVDAQTISQQYQPTQSFLYDQIANEKGRQNFANEYTNQSAQNEDERHLSILAMVSRQSGGFVYSTCNGACPLPAGATGNISGNSMVKMSAAVGPLALKRITLVPLSGNGGASNLNPYAQNGNDPLMLPNSQATLIGWSNQAPLASQNITINGAHVNNLQETLIQAPLSIDLSQASALPDTLLSGHIVNASTSIQNSLQGLYTTQNGSITYEYSLPGFFTQHSHAITITEPSNLQQFIGQGPTGKLGDTNTLQVQLYNWQKNSWDTFTFSNYTLPMQDIQPYVDAGGRLLIELSAHGDTNSNAIPFVTPQLVLQGA